MLRERLAGRRRMLETESDEDDEGEGRRLKPDFTYSYTYRAVDHRENTYD